MVLDRERRNNAGKPPQRPYDAVVGVAPPLTPSTASYRASGKARRESVILGASQASASSRNSTLTRKNTPIQELIRPASLRR
jgi:hypothetical protein